MSDKIEKKTITLSFDKDSIQEFRRVLCLNGLRPQEFFGFIVEKVSNMDPRLNELLKEAGNFKSDRIIERKIHFKTDADSIYKAIAKNLKDKQNSL